MHQGSNRQLGVRERTIPFSNFSDEGLVQAHAQLDMPGSTHSISGQQQIEAAAEILVLERLSSDPRIIDLARRALRTVN